MTARQPKQRGVSGLLALLRGRVLLTAIPFTLLVNTSTVLLNLKVERDGSALRQISVSAAPYFQKQLPRWVADVRMGADWDGAWAETTESAFIYARDARLPGLPDQGEETKLIISDVFQNPLSWYTTYQWREVISVSYLYATDPTAAQAVGKTIKYTVQMPGTVTSATVSPSTGSTATSEGDQAVFELDASQGKQTIDVQSARLRWGYLLLVAYVLCYILYRLGRVLAYRLHIRPRKI